MVNALRMIELFFRDVEIVLRTASPSPLRNLISILGPFDSWDLTEDSLSEHRFIGRLLAEQRERLRPSRLTSPRGLWEALSGLDRLRSRFLPLPVLADRPASIASESQPPRSEEAWFFVNGIAAEQDMLRLNGVYLSRLFRRPIELIYNPTHGPFADLLECLTGRTFDYVSAPARYALERISDALDDEKTERVILMGHSQGGIVVSNVVEQLLGRFGNRRVQLAKLEIYTLASACDEMKVFRGQGPRGRHLPHVEHFANTGDWVARLGVLARRREVAGKVYTYEKDGHLLNAHYLPEIENKERYAWVDLEGKSHYDARLFAYLNGGVPVE